MKLSIIGGAGTLGAAVAFRLCQNKQVNELCLIDVNEPLLMNHIMDLQNAYPEKTIYKGSYEDLTGSSIVIITAGVPNRNDVKSRTEFLEGNIMLFNEFGKYIKKYSESAFIITASNPVDVLNYYLYREFGFKKSQLLGYTVNDSRRLEHSIRKVMSISEEKDVFSPVIGEHGNTQVPLFSLTQVNGKPFSIDADKQIAIREEITNWFIDFNRLNINRTTGWATASGIGKIIDGITNEEKIETVGSAILEGEYGINDISIGVPVSISLNGIESIQDWKLSNEELKHFRQSAETIRHLIEPYILKEV
ncbi:malate dehydrogenase [Sporosarcina newyorkensis]|uniref:Malate dehydrogenase n=1 Tax=Sporosarcina newyorkensis TaxID=759851 RepID=A0A1T4Y8E1_9BACL|nr:hypothetical protein [Sporosarcina newyorkensis]SKA97996.1 malate dehydrogenase [Sporosarcina newyorkensis]